MGLAVITGGSSGIGAVYADRFTRRGYAGGKSFIVTFTRGLARELLLAGNQPRRASRYREAHA